MKLIYKPSLKNFHPQKIKSQYLEHLLEKIQKDFPYFFQQVVILNPFLQ